MIRLLLPLSHFFPPRDRLLTALEQAQAAAEASPSRKARERVEWLRLAVEARERARVGKGWV